MNYNYLEFQKELQKDLDKLIYLSNYLQPGTRAYTIIFEKINIYSIILNELK